jgi:hypothetical protein
VPATGVNQRAGWGFQILPYVEQEPLYKGGGGTTIEECQRRAIAGVVPLYFCSSRRSPFALPATGSWYGPGGTYQHGTMDYAASQGTGNNGAVVFGGPMLSIHSIPDGSSNTIFIGEKALWLPGMNNYQGDDNEGYSSGWDHDVIRRTDRAPIHDLSAPGWGEERFGSSHSAGFNAFFGDGVVRTISYSVNLTNFANMGRRDDGGTINFDQ